MLKAQRRAVAPVDRPEAKLLLCCAQVIEESERAAPICKLLREEIDWPYLLRMALPHGMMPLLYWHLNATCPEAVPKPAMDRLRERFLDNTRRNLFLTGELLRLLNLFEAQQIPAVPYKGPVLAATVYGNLALRHFYDVDILVHRRDVPRARELLISAGYRPEFQLTQEQEVALLRYGFEQPFIREDGTSIVELHWEIIPRTMSFPLDTKRLWGRLQPVSLGGKVIPSLFPEDLLLILCVHGSKHIWERLAWIRDVAGLVQVYRGIDWDRVVQQADVLGGSRMLFIGLLLARDLLGAALPEGVSHKMEDDPVARSLAEEVRERLFWEPGKPPEEIDESMFVYFRLKVRERLRDRARYLIRMALTPSVTDWEYLPLPAALSPLYYVIRPVRQAAIVARRVAKRLPG